ncbi:MAG: universal stress protein [Planctomycetaceae bacterium]
MIKRILVDLSDVRRGSTIARYATELGCQQQAEVTVVREVTADVATPEGPLLTFAAAGWARQLRRQSVIDSQEAAAAAVEELRVDCTAKGVPFQIVEREPEAFRTIVERFQFFDLFVCGTNLCLDANHLETGSEGLIQLVEQGVRPILAVSDEHRPFDRVLVALSGDADSAQTLKQFIQSGICPTAELEIVTFAQDERAQRILSESMRYCRRHGVEPVQQVLKGPMSEELLPHAVESGADLIVLGNSDHSRLARWFFGGAVMEIIRESDRSLFLSQ